MEKITTSTRTESDKILFNVEDDSFENFDFKPLSKGLGFHHEKKEHRKSFKIKNELGTQLKEKSASPIVNNKNKEKLMRHSSALDAFYGRSHSQVQSTQVSETKLDKKKKIKVKKAALVDIVSAWIIDILIFASSQIFMLMAMVTFLNTKPEALLVGDYIPYLSLIAFLNYLLFFSLLNCSDGFGASLMGIRLVTLKNKKLRFITSFSRTFIVLLSFVCLGVPLLFDFQGKLTDSKWIKKNV